MRLRVLSMTVRRSTSTILEVMRVPRVFGASFATSGKRFTRVRCDCVADLDPFCWGCKKIEFRHANSASSSSSISSTSSASRAGRTSRGSQCISYLISFFRLPGSADIAQNGVPGMPSRVLAGRDPQRDRLDQNQQCATRTMG